MSAARTFKRKLLWTFAGLAVLLGALLALLPVWLPWAVRPAAGLAGVTWQTYERRGYTRAALHDVRGQFGNVTVTAGELAFFLPNRWLWHHYLGGAPADSHVQVSNWRLDVRKTERRITPSTNSMSAVLDRVNRLLPALRRWLPQARLTNGVVAIQDFECRIAQAVWGQGQLSLDATAPAAGQTLSLRVDLGTTNRVILTGDLQPFGAATRLEAQRAADRWTVDGDASWRRNRLDLSAQFGADGWLPDFAQVEADAVRVPAELLTLDGYQELTGALDVVWRTNQFSFNARAALAPNVRTNLATPPLTATLGGRGDLHSLTMETFDLTAPWATSELAGPAGVTWTNRSMARPAELTLAADLGGLALTNVSGRLTGALRLEPRGTNLPAARFEVTGRDVSGAGLTARRVAATARLDWPLVVLEQAQVQLDGDSRLSASARMNLQTRTLLNGQWEFTGGWLRRFLPTNAGYAALTATGAFSGPLVRPVHSGHLTATDVVLAGASPGALEIAWQDGGLDLAGLAVKLTTAQVQLQLGGAVQVSLTNGPAVNLDLQTLDWRRDAQPVYQLAAPARLRARRLAGADGGTAWDLRVDNFHWRGPDTAAMRLTAQAEWPRRGQVQASVRDLELDSLAGWFPLPVEKLAVASLEVSADWNAGPANLTVKLAGRVPGPEDAPVEVLAQIQGGANGLDIRPLRLSADSVPTFTVEGRLPFLLTPANADHLVRFSREMPFDVRVRSAPTANFTRVIGNAGRLTLGRPKLELTLTGNVADLNGTLQLELASATWQGLTNPIALPPLRQVNVDARLDQHRLHLAALSLRWNGQRLQATGEWPLGANVWTDLIERRQPPDWQRASGRLWVEQGDLAAGLQPFVTNLVTQGQFQLDARLEPGGRMRGALQLTNVFTVALPALGTVREVAARITLDERTVTLTNVSGYVGSTPIHAHGHGRLTNLPTPPFECVLQGTNVPLVRQPDLIVRSDLDLRLAAIPGQPTTVSGQVTMRDSLVLQKLDRLAPRADTGPGERFPFFRVDTPPLKDWQLDVRITGDKFMRVRTPLLVGLASADFHVQGLLADPQALGEARLNSGRITFPFGRLHVDRGLVTVSSEAPHRPRLNVAASGSVYGYDIKMDVSGPADEPQVLLSSTPPLNSGEILLLLTAGELPSDPSHFSQQDRAQTLALFVGKDLLARILGSESAEERLTINSGEHISESGRSTYVIEYKLADDWALAGEYDRFDSLNAYLKWRFYKR